MRNKEVEILRLDRFLHEVNCGTRKEIKKLLSHGRITLNDDVVKQGAVKITESDSICLDGEPLIRKKGYYVMLNKPTEVITARLDSIQTTVCDLLPEEIFKKVVPVGRLDKDTTGLLFMTDDGELLHRLTHPNWHVSKTYLVHYEGILPDDATTQVAKGLNLHDGPTLPATLTIHDHQKASLTIKEGRYHQVKRMFAALGCKVHSLHRYSIGPLILDEDLDFGQWRELTEDEIRKLYDIVGLKES